MLYTRAAPSASGGGTCRTQQVVSRVRESSRERARERVRVIVRVNVADCTPPLRPQALLALHVRARDFFSLLPSRIWCHRRPFVGLSQARSWSPWLVLGVILWAFIVKS